MYDSIVEYSLEHEKNVDKENSKDCMGEEVVIIDEGKHNES